MNKNKKKTEKEIFQQIKRIIIDRLGIDSEKIKREAAFTSDLKTDSLDIVELILSLEEEFEISISDEKATKIHTVGEATMVICELLEIDIKE